MRLSSLFISFSIIVIIPAYALSNWQKYGSFFASRDFKNVEFVNLIGFANLYKGQNVCTKGYIVEGKDMLFIKNELGGSRFESSAWIVSAAGKSFLFNTSDTVPKAVTGRVCGRFESKPESDFGNPPFWKHQLTINEFDKLGDPFTVNY